MAKGSSRRISRSARKRDGCLWGLFRMFDFNHSCNSQRLLSNREYVSGKFAADERYSSDAIDLLPDFEEKDTAISLPGQNEAKTKTSYTHTGILANEEIHKVQHGENHLFPEKKQMQASSAYKDLSSSSDIHSKNVSHATISHLDAHDLAAPTKDECSACPIHTLAERFCDGLQLATLLQEIDIERNNNQGTECRKNSHFSASANTSSREVHTPCQPDEHMNPDSNFLWKFCDEVLRMEEMASNGTLCQSDNLSNALKLLSSNRELLDQFRQDPDSKLMKRVRELQSSCQTDHSETVSDKSHQKQNELDLFRKDDNPEVQMSEGSAKKIVVLKPIPSRMDALSISSSSIPSLQYSPSKRLYMEGRRVTFDLFFQELKKRLRSAIRDMKKERKSRSTSVNSCVAMDGNGGESQRREMPKSLDVDSNSVRDIPKDREKKTVGILERESNFQSEAKRHLIEMLRSNSDRERKPEKRASEALWNILSLQDYNKTSPAHGSGRHKELSLSHSQMRYSPLWTPSQQENSERINLARHCMYGPDCSSTSTDAESHVPESIRELLRNKIKDGDSTEADSMEASMKITDSSNAEISETLITPDEISDRDDDKIGGLNGIHVDEETQSQRMDSSDETESTTPSIHHSSLPIHDSEIQEIIMEKLERPSPVSVLIPPFTDDATCSSSPLSEKREEVGLPTSPRELHFDDCEIQSVAKIPMGEEEFKLEYVQSLLDASGLIHVETWERRQSLRDLLEPSLFDQVEIPFGDIPYDPILIFNCTGEILEEIREKYFPRKPWASLIQHSVRPFPRRESLVKEVCGRTSCHCATQSRNSLNQVIENDLNTTVWLDTSGEIDNMGIAIEDEILENILEELVSEIAD